MRRQIHIEVLFSIWVHLSCKYLFLVLWGLLRANTTQTPSQCRIEKYIVIKLLLIDRGCNVDSGAEPWILSQNIRAFKLANHKHLSKLQSHIFHQWGFSDNALSQNICGTLILFSLVGLFNSGRVTCLVFMSQPGCQLFTYRSLPVKQEVSYSGRSWALKLYLTPIQNGSFIQNVFNLVLSYTRHC